MKVLSLSLDTQLFTPHSVVSSRNSAYGNMLEAYTIIVPSSQGGSYSLSSNTWVYSTGYKNKVLQLFSMYRIAQRLLKNETFDVITSQDTYFLGFIGWLLARTNHCGLEVQVLGIEKLTPFRKLLSKFVLSRASSIRVLSLGLQKRLITEFCIPTKRMNLVPIYVDVSSLGLGTHVSREQQSQIDTVNNAFKGKYANSFNIVSVNRLVPIKNISMQLEAIEILAKEFPHILLHIVGDGPLHDSLASEIKKRNIEKNVLLQGFKKGIDLSCFFTQSDCFVLTSDFEGYGMVAIEAATAGLPIVMTDVGCAGEVIIHEKSGIIVPPKDTQAFVTALRRIIVDATLRENVGIGAKNAIATLPSFEEVLQKYKASWQYALENKL